MLQKLYLGDYQGDFNDWQDGLGSVVSLQNYVFLL